MTDDCTKYIGKKIALRIIDNTQSGYHYTCRYRETVASHIVAGTCMEASKTCVCIDPGNGARQWYELGSTIGQAEHIEQVEQ